MRYYLIIGAIPAALNAVIPVFDKSGEFKCLGMAAENAINWSKILKLPPELILINLDDPKVEVSKIIKKCNIKLGVIPNYIGITTSYEKGFNAFRVGFVDVILAPFTKIKILKVLDKYRVAFWPSYIYCIDCYYDFFYINLHDLLLIKADNYNTDFFMRDGSIHASFKNLKKTHPLLPSNFQRINRSYVINSFYVYRIHTGKSQLYLRHYDQILTYTKKYRNNIFLIKKQLLKAPESIFA
ncbi:LytTR family DNA-binding domain-containing protein [Aequorivita vitellina]|uniref:LytTR family DNA-binding domain-containing protein n=1 Tax=Aequorivita vitellina TaxID=2874475 RepID=UPI001F31DD6F|nr:LytTR family DNA-binding domain-containing protein [Aequorivita vitellina]